MSRTIEEALAAIEAEYGVCIDDLATREHNPLCMTCSDCIPDVCVACSVDLFREGVAWGFAIVALGTWARTASERWHYAQMKADGRRAIAELNPEPRL